MDKSFLKKKTTVLSGIFIGFLLICIALLNIQVTTRQGVNYKVQTLKLPAYLKILDFFDRHYNYKWLTHRIIEDKTSEQEQALAIFNWTVKNIARKPEGLPAIDDHVWHIIVRGYGTADQFSDVFTTLCNYADLDAFFSAFFHQDRGRLMPLSFVKLNNKWCVFDPYAGTYLTKRDGSAFASVEDIAAGNWTTKGLNGDLDKVRAQYKDHFRELSSINFTRAHRWSRANIQSPMNRLLYGLKRCQR